METKILDLINAAGSTRDSLLGFKLGDTYESQRLQRAKLLSFGLEPTGTQSGELRRVLFTNENSTGHETAAVFLEYGSDDRLTSAMALAAGDVYEDAPGAAAAAAVALRDLLLRASGAPAVAFDNISDWAADHDYRDSDASAYSAFWPALKQQAEPIQAVSAENYLLTMHEATGPLLSATISTAKASGVMQASLMLQLRP